ncbi:MAG TPA: hypothetical protein VF646_06135 [Cytophagales bacterium]|jgi:hypothetical protein
MTFPIRSFYTFLGLALLVLAGPRAVAQPGGPPPGELLASHRFSDDGELDGQLNGLLRTVPVRDTATRNTFVQKITAWLGINAVAADEALAGQLRSFTEATYLNVYTAGTLEGDQWLVRKLNELAYARHEVNNDPYLLFTLKLSENPSTGRCQVRVVIQASTRIPAALVTQAAGVINGKLGNTYARPGDSQAEVNAALAAGLEVFRKALGSSLAPTLAIRSGGRLYADGNTLEADQQAGGSLGLEAVNRQGVLIASRVEWVGVSATGSRASFPLDRPVSQPVVLRANGEQVRLTVEVKAGSTREQLLAALDELVFEVLNELIAKNKRQKDSLETLKAADEKVINEKADRIIALRNQASVGAAGTSEVGTVLNLSPEEGSFEEEIPAGLLAHADYGEYIRRRENNLRLLKTLRFLYAHKEIILTLLKPGAIPDLVKEIENDAGSLIVSLTAQLLRGERDGIKSYLTSYLTTKITALAQQKVANE